MTKWDGLALGIGFAGSLALFFVGLRHEQKRNSPRDEREPC